MRKRQSITESDPSTYPTVEISNDSLQIKLHPLTASVYVSLEDGIKLATQIVRITKLFKKTTSKVEATKSLPKVARSQPKLTKAQNQTKKKKKKKKKIKGFMYGGKHSTYIVGPAPRSTPIKFNKPTFKPRTILRKAVDKK
jgi:hypothetical protein